MPQHAPGRLLPLILVMVVGVAALIAILWWLNNDQGGGRSTPAPTPENTMAAALPTTPPRSAQEEIACFDRLAAGNLPEGVNVQAAFEACRYVPAPDANMSEADLAVPINAATPR